MHVAYITSVFYTFCNRLTDFQCGSDVQSDKCLSVQSSFMEGCNLLTPDGWMQRSPHSTTTSFDTKGFVWLRWSAGKQTGLPAGLEPDKKWLQSLCNHRLSFPPSVGACFLSKRLLCYVFVDYRSVIIWFVVTWAIRTGVAFHTLGIFSTQSL